MSNNNISDFDPRFLIAVFLFAAAVQLLRMYSRRRNGSKTPRVIVILIVALGAAVAFLGYEVYRSAQVNVGLDEYVIVTRFGKPTRPAVLGPGRILITPLGIDAVRRYPKRVGTVELPCECLRNPVSVTVFIEDPMLFFETGVEREGISQFICTALCRQYGADGDGPFEIDGEQLDSAISGLGLKAGIQTTD